MASMHYLDFLRELHGRLRPRTYLEIGVRHGDSLALAPGWAVGVDPSPRLRGRELGPKTRVYRQTSDAFFARRRPMRWFDDRRISLAFIDGLHQSEFALRDFIHVERHARWRTVVVFDDVLPRDAEMASRERATYYWAGDVYKLAGVLRAYRPDLILLLVDTEPTGLLIVLGLDPHSTVLADNYDRIEAELRSPDPQTVPREVLERKRALVPAEVLEAPFWGYLRRSRGKRVERRDGVHTLRRRVRRDLGRRSGVSYLDILRRR